MTSDIETQESVFNGHFVERGSFLIAEECVRNPDFSPAVVAETKRSDAAVACSEDKSRVPPRLTQVHTDRVVKTSLGSLQAWRKYMLTE